MITLLLGWTWSCAQTQVISTPGPFYVTPQYTYLRDSPGYAGNVVGQLSRGDEVKRVEVGESNWWRVELLRSGQRGWVRQELLSSEPVSTEFYYVSEDSVPLRECPGIDCHPLQMLYRGDQVKRVEEGEKGWWRILAVKSRSLGWVPAGVLTGTVEEARAQQPQKPYYYVAVRKLRLRAQPSPRSETIRTLQFNDQVKKIGETAEGWIKVRQPSSGAVGWVSIRALETLPLLAPRGERPAREELKPFKQREEPLVEPEFM